MQQLVQRHRVNAQHGLIGCNHACLRHIDRDFQRGLCRALARTGLQHPQFFTLNGEFNILHIAIMRFQDVKHPRQLGIYLRHRLFHRQRLCARPLTCGLGQILRRADSGNDIFALRVDQIFAIIGVFASGRVTGKGNARRRCFAHIAEDHGLHINRSAPVTRDIVEAAINLCPVRFP